MAFNWGRRGRATYRDGDYQTVCGAGDGWSVEAEVSYSVRGWLKVSRFFGVSGIKSGTNSSEPLRKAFMIHKHHRKLVLYWFDGLQMKEKTVFSKASTQRKETPSFHILFHICLEIYRCFTVVRHVSWIAATRFAGARPSAGPAFAIGNCFHKENVGQ